MTKERGEIGAKSARVKGILRFWATIRRYWHMLHALGAGMLRGAYGVPEGMPAGALDWPLGWARTECSV
jgi:hypothetical protein